MPITALTLNTNARPRGAGHRPALVRGCERRYAAVASEIAWFWPKAQRGFTAAARVRGRVGQAVAVLSSLPIPQSLRPPSSIGPAPAWERIHFYFINII